MSNHRCVTTTAFLAVALVLCGPLTSCVDIRITTAAVVAGPTGGALTLQLGATLTLEEGAGDEQDPSANEPTRGAIGIVALGLPARATVDAVRISGPTAMVGATGSRAMGLAPQVARIYDTEFAADDVTWVAYHVILDEVDLRQPQAVSVEIDLAGISAGVQTVWVAPGSVDDATTAPAPVRPTQLELAVGADKATVRIVPSAAPAGKGVQA